MNVSGGSFVGNSATNGGAIYNTSSGTVNINGETTFSKNSAYSNDDATSGGAIYNLSGGTVNINGETTFSDNYADDGGAIYNTSGGTVNMANTVTLETKEDAIYNTGTLNWDLTGENAGKLVGYQYLDNDPENGGKLTITVSTAQALGSCTIATGDFNMDKLTQKNKTANFTVNAGDSSEALTVNGGARKLNGNAYSISLVESSISGADQLVLSVAECTEREELTAEKTLDPGKSYTAEAYDQGHGGLFSVADSGSITGENVTFANNAVTGDNKKGGAIYNDGTVTLTGENSFSGNSATGNGGAFYNNDSAAVSISGASFSGNMAAGSGGAFYNYGTAELNGGASFSYNTASYYGGAIYNVNGSITISGGVDFSYNTSSSKYGGGAIYNQGTNGGAAAITISGKTAFTGNSKGYFSGAIYNKDDATLTLNGETTFSGNGGAIRNDGGTVNMANTVTLETEIDTIYNTGTLTWDLTGENPGKLVGYQYLTNEGGQLTIKVKAEETAGSKYVIATGDFSARTLNTNNTAAFTVTDGISNLNLTVDNITGVINGLTYKLALVESDEAGADQLVLTIDTPISDRIVVSSDSSVTLDQAGAVYFCAPYSGDGGAVEVQKDGTVTGIGVTFSGNTATGNGGAIWSEEGTVKLDNVIFNGNSAGGSGGAIYGGDIELLGKVYLVTSNDTIWMGEDNTLTWTIDGNKTGYLSDYSLITGNVDAETFEIDAEVASVGHCYVLAGNAGTADGQTFTVTVTGADGAEQHTMTVGSEMLVVDDVSYILKLNESNELILSVNQHLVVDDYTLRIDSVQDFSWAGMDTYTGNGSIFEITSSGIMTNVFFDGEGVRSCAVSFKDGSVTGNGGMIYNAGNLALDNALFEANTAEENGGAIYSTNCVFVTNGSFFSNEAEYGGAVYISSGTGNYLSGLFEGNTAVEKGGAIYVASGAALSMGDTTFKGNEADEGGAIYSEGTLLLTGELVLSSSDDNFTNYGTVTLDYASNASIRGYQYLTNNDDGKVCISVAGLEAGTEIWNYEFAKGNFTGDYAYVDEFTLTNGTSEATISVGGGQVEFNGLNYFVEINETGDVLRLNAYAKKDISITLIDTEKMYDGIEMTCPNYETSGTLKSGDELVFTVSDTITDVGSKDVTVSSWQVLRDGADVSYEYNMTSTTGCTISVTPRQVTLTSASKSKVYDGTALTDDTVTESGDGFIEGEGATYTVTGSQTEVGSSPNYFNYTLNNGTKAANYDVTKVEGTLTVTGWDQLVTITADSNSKMYDGSALTDSGYTVTGLAAGHTITVTTAGEIIHFGTADNVVTSYTILDANGHDVTAAYSNITTVDGKLSITKRDVTLTSGSATKKYDGTPLTNETVTVSGSGFVNGEGASYYNFASRTEIGSSANTFNYVLNNGTSADDYAITTANGTLTVTPSFIAYTISESVDTIYDGTAKTVSVTVTDPASGAVVYYSTDGGTTWLEGSSYSLTDAGSADVCFKMTADTYEDTYSESRTIAISKRSVTLTSADAVKKFDGLALTADQVTLTGDGWAEGEGASCSDFASQTRPGESANAFTYTLNDGTLAANYDVTKVEGTLTVERAVKKDLDLNTISDVVITLNSDTHPQNGLVRGLQLQADGSVITKEYSQMERDWTVLGTGFTAAGKETADIYLVRSNNKVGVWVTDASGSCTWQGIDDFGRRTNTLAVGDFNGDGQSDLLQMDDNGAVGCYFTGGEKTGWNYFQSIGREWEIGTVGDFNGDGVTDTMLRHEAGYAGTWLTGEDGSVKWASLDMLSSDMEIAGSGDFNGDNVDDILLRKGDYFGAWIVEDGRAATWMGLGTVEGLTFEGIGDYDGDGTDDLLFSKQNADTCDLGAMLVTGEDQLKWKYISSVGNEWSVNMATIA